MTAPAYGDKGSQQGIRALENGVAFGGKFRFFTGDGTPAAAFTAKEVGDLYLDYTNAVLYIASATGTGSWTAYAGLSSMASGATIGGTSIFTGSGDPSGVITAVRIGDLYVDYTNAVLYIAIATGTGSWQTLPRYTQGAAATTSDGGTITHGFGTTPTVVTISGSVAGQTVTVTSIGATTFTVAIKTNLGAAGTAQTIYWRAS
jgi:hypothetical protein